MAPGISVKQSPSGVSYPPLDGSLYLPEMVEFNAKRNPTHPFYTFHDEYSNELRHISHLEFYRACQRVAHAIRPNRKGSDNEVIAIIANCDTILFQALVTGVMFAGLIPFPMSPRNSPAAVLNMMQKSGCRRLMATRHSLGSLLDGITTEVTELHIEDPPTLAYAYPELGKETESTPFIPYPKAEVRPLKEDILYYLHSSGSTGFPKPIPTTNLTAVHWCLAPSVQDHVNFPKHITIGAASLPPFHMMGMLMQIYLPVASLQSVAVFSPTSYHDPRKAPIIPNPQNSIEVIQTTKSNSAIVVPAFLEEWATSAQAIDVLRSLEYVAFGGGPLAKRTGDALATAGVNLSSAYGGTEFGPLTYVLRDSTERQLWEWLRFGKNQNIRWVPQGDGTYECQVLTSETHQLSLSNLPDVRGYATSDVFIKHPTIEGLYRIVGRLDDVLIHSSGEKTVPAPMETVIGANPILSGVCMFGRGRNQTGVLVEPRPEYTIDVTNDEQVTEFRNKIWREIEEANKEAPAFSRIFKEMILVTSKEKPMLRAGKGTVIKKATMKLYESEVDALYASVEASARAGIDVPLPPTWSQIDVEKWLLVHATAVNAGKPIEVDADVFEQGFDSLSSTFLRNRIVGSLAASSHETIQAAASQISQNIVFANPTLRLLARRLIQLLAGEEASFSPDPKVEIEDMIAKYSIGLGGKVSDDAPGRFHDRHVVLLTGSTGGLGSYLLASLLSREDVALVYAFNRPSKTNTIQHRQRAAFEDRGLDTALLDSDKLIYVEGDAARPNLSLDDWTYAEIRDSVTVIIHNAWRLDFNLALSSFESNVGGTRHLIDLARASRWATKPRFLFTSSVASAQGWDKSRGAFPEEVQYDAGVAAGPGYGASKYVSERILTRSGLPATSFRIGQVTGGAPRGAWSTTDWVPIIVKSSVSLGALPEARGVISWLPPHGVCDAILDVAFAHEEPPLVVNLVHPRPSTWKSVMQPISEALYQKHLTSSRLPLIPFTEWVERLEEEAANTNEENAQRVPAVKLLGFLRALAQGDAVIRRESSSSEYVSEDVEAAGSPRFATDVAQRASETMHHLEPLSAVDAERWVEYWASVGMFNVPADLPNGV
ncbi:putative aminoadipate reductase [Boletus edulis BED1]|uniref:Aminoadipate reductase n=1 Tax=Boletus edulis BED1 TaxID=1328754 RepID=A0AAD4GDR2_BOLED|nr:putative aminoadipate reductase [Boletus edulis BED1]